MRCVRLLRKERNLTDSVLAYFPVSTDLVRCGLCPFSCTAVKSLDHRHLTLSVPWGHEEQRSTDGVTNGDTVQMKQNRVQYRESKRV